VIAQLDARRLGFILIGIAAVCLTIAAVVGYHAAYRWFGVAEANARALAQLDGDAERAGAAARAAAHDLPDHAATVLPSLDPSDPESESRIARLLRVVPSDERGAVRNALAFSNVVRGKAQGNDCTGGDAVLLAWLTGEKRTDAFPTGALGSAPPHRAVLRYSLERAFAEAWVRGDRDLLRATAGPLLLEQPRHPEVPRLRAIVAVLDPAMPIQAARLDTIPEEQRTPLVRHLCLLSPSRRLELLATIPAEKRTREENQVVLMTSKESLETLVGRALAAPSEGLLRDLCRRCLDAGSPEQAQRLVDSAPDSVRNELKTMIAVHRGDLAALSKLTDRSDLKPACTRPIAAGASFAFHLGTVSGLIPWVGTIVVEIGGTALPTDKVARYGSLVVVETRDPPPYEVVVRLDDTVAFAGQVQP
jgi:hypothetical protein